MRFKWPPIFLGIDSGVEVFKFLNPNLGVSKLGNLLGNSKFEYNQWRSRNLNLGKFREKGLCWIHIAGWIIWMQSTMVIVQPKQLSFAGANVGLIWKIHRVYRRKNRESLSQRRPLNLRISDRNRNSKLRHQHSSGLQIEGVPLATIGKAARVPWVLSTLPWAAAL